LKRFIFIAGSFTEREIETLGAVAVYWVGPLMLNLAVERQYIAYTPTSLLDRPFHLINIFFTGIYIFFVHFVGQEIVKSVVQ
jgi:hypothetical protein